MSHFNIILFSKYSEICKKFVNTINKSNINLQFNFLCIDNINIRNRITKSSNIDISAVPCLLIVNNNNVEKYEGQDCFIWYNDIVNQHILANVNKKHEPEPIHREQSQPEPEQQSEPEPETEQQHQPSNGESFTNIDSIDASLEDESLVHDSTYRDFNTGTKEKKRPEHTKRDNLLSTAMQMMKSREIEDKNINKNPNLLI